ncbi:MAG: helix-turn-helix transcriptional regulator, partial [Deltaproteobacteria bacterium]|nr:helix-turn-helix transcriptional regulator [Deltaproteobacteria bacterium]
MSENNPDKREIIIQAAQQVLAEKGLRKSTVAEIARRGGVFDSEIYRHFKDKEDLLFCSLAERI